jgi:hypothetical protein
MRFEQSQHFAECGLDDVTPNWTLARALSASLRSIDSSKTSSSITVTLAAAMITSIGVGNTPIALRLSEGGPRA